MPFASIPLIGIQSNRLVEADMDCFAHGFFDVITSFAPSELVLKRIYNAIRASDSITFCVWNWKNSQSWMS